MNGILKGRRKAPEVIYTLKPSKPGQKVVSDVHLPDGTIIRRVDENVHRLGLENVNRRYREILNAG